jgi:GTP-binding protein
VAPPTIVLFATARISTEYLRYLENRIREEEPFAGTPIRLQVRLRARREVKG